MTEEVVAQTNNQKPQYIISCDYDEFHPSTYRGYVVDYTQVDNSWERRFDTGNPIQDWADVLAFLYNTTSLVARLSSCDSFITDMRLWLSGSSI